MTYGDLPLDAPEKPNKGLEGGACNRRACQAEPALWWNRGSHSWYCEDCARDIREDPVNKQHWELRWQPACGHPMFETREQMNAREPFSPFGKGDLYFGDHHLGNITFDSPVDGNAIHEKLQAGLDMERRYHILPEARLYFDPPIRNRDKPAATYNHPPESRQVRRARERAEFKRLPRRA